MNKAFAVGAAALSLALGLTSAQQPIRVGIAFDAGGKDDRSFNQSANEGAQRAVRDLKIQTSDFEPQDPSQVGQGIRNFAQNGFDLVIGVGFANEPSITAAAKNFPDQKFAVVDAVPTGPNTTGLVFREQEGSYLVGYIAGKTSSTGVVGFVGGMQIPLIKKFEVGYTAGVKAACPSCRVVANYVGTTPAAWSDPARAKEIATNQAARGADILYAAAGASGAGVQQFVNTTMCVTPSRLPSGVRFKGANAFARVPKSAAYTARCAASARPMFFIGVDSNQNYIGDTDNNPATLNHGLTSMLKRVDNAVYAVINDVVKGTGFKSGAREFGLSNNGVGYALDQYNQALIPQSLRAQVDNARARIISGAIKVPFE